MGTLAKRGSEQRIDLRSRCLLGRSPACDVRVDDPRISGEHASVRWTSAGWELRDLASKNGTFVDGRRLAAQERVVLVPGSTIRLGAPSGAPCELELVDATPPIATAYHLGTGIVREAQAGMLLLPDEEQPRASLLEAENGRWRLETIDACTWVSEGEVVLVEGERWRLDLPMASATVDAAPTARTLVSLALRFGVSQDEERVEVRVVDLAGETPLPPRSHQYLLLTLARARIRDGGAPPDERGWVERDDLCRMLKMDEYALNVDVCRARKQFASLGITGASDIVQRRMGTGRMRLGVERVSVQKL